MVFTDERVIQRRHHVLGEHLLVIEHVLDGTSGGARHVVAKMFFPLERRAFM